MDIYVLSILSIIFVSGGSSSLAPPRNVRVVCYNMDAVLKWDVPQNPSSKQVYRAEVKFLSEFEYLCLGTRQQCATVLPSCHGHYKFRVRAELGEEASNWSRIANFFPQTQIVIGPPTVAVVAKGDAIVVTIQDPALKISSLRKCYSDYTYFLRYWRADLPQNVTSRYADDFVILKSLELETRYCLQARVHITPYKIDGQYSNTTCVMTPAREKRWSWTLVVSLVVVAVALPLLLITALLVEKGRRFLNPKVSLPEHFKQHLFEAPCRQDTTTHQEQCDTISTVYEERPYHDVTHQTENGEERVLLGNKENSDETPRYRNAMVASDMSYRNI